MASFANDNAYQKCASNLPENIGKKMVVFGTPDAKIELSKSIHNISQPKVMISQQDRLPSKIPNLLFG
jgi:hypothetical protein